MLKYFRLMLAALLSGAIVAGFDLLVAGGGQSTSTTPEHLMVGFVSGLLYAVVLTPLAMRLPPRRWVRLASLFVPLYVTGMLTDLIEGYVFTTLLTPTSLVAGLVIEVLPALAVAVVVALLVPTDPAAMGPPTEVWRRHWSLPAWAWRIVVVGLLYVPAYYAFGALVTPIEHPYYSDPAFIAQLHTRTPPDGVIIPLETLRGALFGLALLPVLSVLPGRRWSTLAYLTLIGVVFEAIVPLLGLSTWPLAMRLGNFVELTGDAFARAIVVLALFGHPPLSIFSLRQREEPANSS
jgi:hypothetical protein